MENSKTYRLFHSLTKAEILQIKQELKGSGQLSPLITNLFLLLCRQHPTVDVSLLGKQKLYSKLWPNRKYDDLTIRRHLSVINKYIIDFLNFKTLNKDEWEWNYKLLEIYERGQLHAQTVRVRQKLHDYLDQGFTKNERYYKRKLLLYQFEFRTAADDAKHTLMNKINQAADLYFVFVKIRLALLIKSRAKIFKINDGVSFLPTVKAAYEKGLFKEYSHFKLYYYALLLTEGAAVFSEYERIFFAEKDKMDYREKELFFYTGLNYIIRQVNKGERTKYGKIALNWYKWALGEAFLLVNSTLSPTTFNNIVAFGCRAGEIDWTLQFISKYIHYLSPAIRNDEEEYSKAIVYFQMKDFEKSVAQLTDYSFSSKYIMKTRLLLIRSYFELFFDDVEYYQILLSNLTAYESYLNKNKLWSQKAKLPYLNSCRVIRKIANKHNKMANPEKILGWYEAEMEKNYAVIAKIWIYDLLKEKYGRK